jgi:signal transduction histidine kinase
VLIPSAALLGTGGAVTGFLISDGVSARDFATYFVQSSGTMVQVTSAVQQERMTSLRAVGGDRQALAGLPVQWTTTNAELSRLFTVANAVQALNPQVASSSNAELHELAAQLAVVRQGVQAGRESPGEVDSFYTRLDISGTPFFEGAAAAAPNSPSALDETVALGVNSAADLHSRVAGLGAGWAESGALPQPDRLTLAHLTGAYRTQLQALAPELSPSGQAAYAQLTAGPAWRLATSGEDDLAGSGKLNVPAGPWLAAENTVSAALLGLWGDELRYAQNAAVAAANQSLSRSVVVGSLVLALAIAAFATAIVLANGLIRRLRRLRSGALELADVTLPSLVRRIGDGEPVDAASEVALSGYGSDEIGQVAEAFNTAQGTAVAAAAAEARARAGISRVFLDIAHRSQLVVHRQLELLDVAEARQGDPEHLELLFQLDHLATRARRNAENLLILGGGQPGRKWRKPEALEDIVRSAVSETEHYARVNAVRLPGVQVQGGIVGDLIHLLAELVDNATAFSPPDSSVRVSGNLVGKGVIVEVEDQGLGIEHAERERLSETLRNPPDFQEMALSGQRHLGLFVVGQLARRHGITVSLVESAYGGIKAIVLIPSGAVTAPGATADAAPLAAGRPGRHEQQSALADPAPALVPELQAREATRPQERPAAALAPGGHALPSQGRSALHAPAALAAQWEAPAGPPGPAPRPGRAGRAPLPRRDPLANLAPGLRADADNAGSARPTELRSPDQARGSMSAFQRGTRMGRDFAGEDNR